MARSVSIQDPPHYKFHRKHKILFGSFSSLVIIFIILSSSAFYMLYIKLDSQYNDLSTRLDSMQKDTNSKLNEVTDNILTTQQELKYIQDSVGKTEEKLSDLNSELTELKTSASSDFSNVIEDSVPSVVTIRTNVAQGTGFVITDDGYVVTNAHVLSGASSVSAINFDKEILEAEFIGYDGDFDVALLKIPGSYDALSLADSDTVQVGEKVIAIGNPLGLQFSVSEGIISAVHRSGINEEDSYLQTDAALNPGNSGGPLINKGGNVVGINNFKIGSGEGLSFALESNYLRDTINKISIKELNQTLI
ncbi:hypothetical protein COU57_01270 [Candidatus Pacearchaeota archaeon CG10_big_fil_rev_8_21_14_0_10_32_14]|nr:MAG: hypothetical protein COU57_01270 [Candidatus Pacearchaeota archaeon CG10_big_fil_rev_8_21_14_0_10_32_14]